MTVPQSFDEAIAYLQSREDFQQKYADYLAIIAQHPEFDTAEDPPEKANKATLDELLQQYNEQPPFDLVAGIVHFFRALGAFDEEELEEETDMQHTSSVEADTDGTEVTLIEEQDLDLLLSVLPTDIAAKLGRSRPPVDFNTANTHDFKASLLNTLSRLALNTPLTVIIARVFRPIFINLAARWLSLLNFTGTGFAVDDESKSTLVLVLTALARTLPEMHQLYPLLLIVTAHPLLQLETLSSLLADAPQSQDVGDSTALSPLENPDPSIFMPGMPGLFLAIHALLHAVPHLPSLRGIVKNLGGPMPPRPIADMLTSHPHLSMRTLGWQVASNWTGYQGPKKEQLRRDYVYDPVLDPSNGAYGTIKTDIPFLDPSSADKPEENILYWPRLPEKRNTRCQAGRCTAHIYQSNLSAWHFEAQYRQALLTEWSTPIFSSSSPVLERDEARTAIIVQTTDIPETLAEVGGFFLFKEIYITNTLNPSLQISSNPNSLEIQPKRYISTQSATDAMQKLAVHISSRLPVVLSSGISSGKATVLRELHHRLYGSYSPPSAVNDIVSINLADKSLDARNLLGSLVSSPSEPGTFVFAEGSLTRAVRLGRWIVFEDIDKASDEVLSTISDLVESVRNHARNTCGGGWGGRDKTGVGIQAGAEWVQAGEGLMLFATRSVPATAAQSAHSKTYGTEATFLGSQYWSHVWLREPTMMEVQQIVTGLYPRLHPNISDCLIQTWGEVVATVNATHSTSTTGLSRSIGLSDLLKWLARVERDYPHDNQICDIAQNPHFQDNTFLDAQDIFLSAFPSRNNKHDAILDILRSRLQLSSERINWALDNRVPEIVQSARGDVPFVQCGRLTLREERAVDLPPQSGKSPFALTRPSLLLLEKLAAAVRSDEPVLLVGETGTGKTTTVGYLANLLGHNLVALNLSTQTEASDLLGGFRPVNESDDIAREALQLINQFTELFSETFGLSRNTQFVDAVQKAYKRKKWTRVYSLFKEAERMWSAKDFSLPEQVPRKKRRTTKYTQRMTWPDFLQSALAWHMRVTETSSRTSRFKFAFSEGPLVKAMRRGDWLLLDEVNLATSETLESLGTVLQGPTASLVLTERGDIDPVPRHPDFRIFACMNPANDVGKRDLPLGLRTRFTELFVESPDSNKDVLIGIIEGYIGRLVTGDRGIISDIADMYLVMKTLANLGRIADGTNQPPHYSIRTLSRSLMFTADFSKSFGVRRAAYEGFMMCFATSLQSAGVDQIAATLNEYLVSRSKSPSSFFSTPVMAPADSKDFVSVGTFWLARGQGVPEAVEDYVLTASVQTKLINLARAISASRFPILLQGPTSSGKTSIIEYLARRSGHTFVRINNHEHTDIQEYLGSYISDPQSGQLVFQEGLLVKAVRHGHWIVLDELNLAPTDVLEALNRLLDDNRELVIPETQEVLRPHPHFMLFATQNPPGLYGGRKVLSRAFRNRFLEMQFSDVPQHELETILSQRCKIAPSYAKKIVAVFLELQRRRQLGRVFEEKNSFVTLRDLFRWGNRGAMGYENLAMDGYMLLAERARRNEDRKTVHEVISQIMKVSLDPEVAYELLFTKYETSLGKVESVVWTKAMKRLFVLMRLAMEHNEPLLLVGETGSGKTSVCQAVAASLKQEISIVNCHQNTETSDLIGSQRPVRNKIAADSALKADAIAVLKEFQPSVNESATLDEAIAQIMALSPSAVVTQILERYQSSLALFAWHDGPLVECMKYGHCLLLDEISLADDSVLERLNSVLEPARQLVIAEKGTSALREATLIAHERFQIIATMNPGGDFGKKELSPALRNRFTEIWVPWLSDEVDVRNILEARLPMTVGQLVAGRMLSYAKWFAAQVDPQAQHPLGSIITLRDLLAWADFISASHSELDEAFRQGAIMTTIDSIGSTPTTNTLPVREAANLKAKALSRLSQDLPDPSSTDTLFNTYLAKVTRQSTLKREDHPFSFQAPTVRLNALRVLRAMQVPKPILLEGSPGVGKTSLVTALAEVSNCRLARINLSDQTDLVDLFGSDVPVEGGKAGEFVWRDAAFLTAMQNGDWVLLDEMNLASQAVLEGLNSCLDHRGSVYIPELDRTFHKHPDFRVFAAQNPTNQGGSRKGLPRSFVDRFTQVYMDDLSKQDYYQICHKLYPQYSEQLLTKMITFVEQLNKTISSHQQHLKLGAPWEINLRDLLRWADAMTAGLPLERFKGQPREFLDTLFLQRFRTQEDRAYVNSLFQSIFGPTEDALPSGQPTETSYSLRIGRTVLPRSDPLRLLWNLGGESIHSAMLPTLHAMSTSLALKQLLILTGGAGSGKSSIVRHWAYRAGRRVRTFRANVTTDTLELLGSFEQYNYDQDKTRNRSKLVDCIEAATYRPSDWSAVNTHLRGDLTLPDSGESPAAASHDPVLAVVSQAQQNKMADVTVKPVGLAAGRFRWVDGLLIEAMKEGDILLIENANECNPAVLDRLNGLFEPNGAIFLSERGFTDDGSIPIVRPHANFRVIMTLDPKRGELSRAMRNRGIELHLFGTGLHDSTRTLRQHTPLSEIQTASSGQSLCHSNDRLDTSIQRTSVLVENLLMMSVGSIQLGYLPYLQTTTLLRNWHQNTIRTLGLSRIWNDLQAQRPAVTDNFPGQSHQIALFAYDSNQALAERACKGPQSHSDRALQCFIRSVVTSLKIDDACRRSFRTPGAMLTVLQQSYVQAVNTSKAITMSKHSQSVYPLLKAFSDFNRALTESHQVLSDPNDVKFEILAELLEELSLISEGQRLNYSLYQHVVRLIREHISMLERSKNTEVNTCWTVLSGALESADFVNARHQGYHMEVIWQYFKKQVTTMTLPDDPDLLALYQDTTRYSPAQIPLDLLVLYFDFLFSPDMARVRSAAANLEALSQKLTSHSKSDTSVRTLHGATLLAVSQLRALALNEGTTGDGRFLLAVASDIDTRPMTNLLSWYSCDGGSNIGKIQDWLLYFTLGSHSKVSRLRTANHLHRPDPVAFHSQTAPPKLASLLQDSELQSALDAASVYRQTSLRELPDACEALKVAGRVHFQLASHPSLDRITGLALAGLNLLHEFTMATTGQQFPPLPTDLNAAAKIIAATLAADSNSVQSGLSRHLDLLQEAMHTDTILDVLSALYCTLGLHMWSSYIPDVPLDPQVFINASVATLKRREDDLLQASALEVRRASNAGARGQTGLLYKVQDLYTLSDEIATSPEDKPRKDENQERLEALFAELRSAQLTLLNSNVLQRTIVGSQIVSIAELESLHISVLAVADRLASTYDGYADLIKPALLSLASCAAGLAIAGHARMLAQHKERSLVVTNIAKDMVAKPILASCVTRNASSDLSRGDIKLAGLSHSSFLLDRLTCVTAIRLATGDRRAKSQLSTLLDIYEQFFEMWANDRRQAESARLESQSIYKSRKQDHIHDEDDEDTAIAKLFPVEIEALQTDVKNQSNGIHATDQSEPALHMDIASKVSQLHLLLFQEPSAVPQISSVSVLDILRQSHHSILEELHSKNAEMIVCSVDLCSSAAGLDFLAEALDQLETSSQVDKDFYHDANVKEATRLQLLIREGSTRITILLQTWPDQMVLTDILEKCEALLTLKATVPIARLLTAVELLLYKVADWEAYASRETSLKQFGDQLSSLAVDWRRLELASWAKLLQWQEREYLRSLEEAWFNLFELCVAGTSDMQAQPTPKDAQYLEKMIEYLHTFMDVSTAGHYSSRLRYLASFAAFTEQLSAHWPSFVSVGKAIRNVHDSFVPYNIAIEEHVKRERGQIERSINEQIRLASWKDVNVHALKASAIKSHRQLYKHVRAYRRLLETPTKSILGSRIEKTAATPIVPDVDIQAFKLLDAVRMANTKFPIPIDSHVTSVPSSLALHNMEATLFRLSKIAQTEMSRQSFLLSSQALDELSAAIVQRSEALRKEVAVGGTQEERLKSVRSQTDRKRKAWSALLGECKRIGLRPRPAAATTQPVKSLYHLFGEASVHTRSSWYISAICKSAESYYYRLVTDLPQIRLAVPEHHPDIAPDQLSAASGTIHGLMNSAMTNRKLIEGNIRHLTAIFDLFDRLQTLHTHGICKQPIKDHHLAISTLQDGFAYLSAALAEIIDASKQHRAFISEARYEDLSRLQDTMTSIIAQSQLSQNALLELFSSTETDTPMSVREASLLEEHASKWTELYGHLSKVDLLFPQFRYLVGPALQWMRDYPIALHRDKDYTSKPSEAVEECQKQLVTVILVCTQDLVKMPTVEIMNEEDYVDGGLATQILHSRTRMACMRLDSVDTACKAFGTALMHHQDDVTRPDVASAAIGLVLPYLSNYLSVAYDHLSRLLHLQRSLLKFGWHLGQLTLSLARQGFCKPEESKEAENGDSAQLEGTGMGEGAGSNNVSNQITDEGQIEGLQDQDSTEKPSSEQDDGEAVDMDQDFGGETEDVADAPDAGDREDDDKDDEQQTEDDIADELGNVNPTDPNSIDEKFWNDESGEGETPKGPEEELDNSAGKPEDGEVGERNDEKPDESGGLPDQADKGHQAEEASHKGDELDIEQDDAESLSGASENAETQRQELPDVIEEEVLDLPEDLNCDPRLDENDATGSDDELEPTDELDEIVDDQASDRSERGRSATPHQEDEHNDQKANNESGDSMPQLMDSIDPEGQESDKDGTDTTDAAVGGSAGADNSSKTEANGNSKVDLDKPEAKLDLGTPAAGSLGGGHEEDFMEDFEANDGEAGLGGTGQRSAPNMQQSAEQPVTESTASGERRLGDPQEEFMRRLQAIADATESMQDNDILATEEDAAGELEYVQQDDEQQPSQQARGIAEKDQVQTSLSRPDDEAGTLDDFEHLALEQGVDAPTLTDRVHHIPDMMDATDRSQQPEDVPSPAASRQTDAQEYLESDNMPHDSDEVHNQKPAPESQLEHWLNGSDTSLRPDEVWRIYTALTRGLSFSLTEALRLVLEPTLATRLKGDYRSGKRLNMRKIIPYIASDFTKDKIWLRRTRPSQREYQILLAVDDSRSMTETRTVHLAYQTVSLVCQALDRLEVGEVSICKFGEQAEFVHNFEDGAVTEAVGSKIVESFTFAQRSTDVRYLLEKSLAKLQDARDRRGSAAADLWQLEVIISDGMCQDLEDIRALLRKARERKIMVVFIVLDVVQPGADSKGSSTSILSLKSVSYQKGKNGALELKMDRYMDSFPFEYYLIVRDIDTLPDILAETLRQFFDKIANSDT